MSKKFLIHVNTAWCGMDNTYSAIAEHESDLYELADHLARENFDSFGGFELVLEDEEPLGEDGEYTDEQIQEIEEQEYDYFYYTIEEFENDEEEWNWYDLVYDCTEKI